jgi:hypothetical protein
MQNFLEWLGNKTLWIDLYLYLFEADETLHGKGIYKNENYHNDLIKKLRTLGLGQDANELEMVRISNDDINFSNSELDSSQNDYHQKRISARLAYNTYMDHIEALIKKVAAHIKNMGWTTDLEMAFDNFIKNRE